MFNRSCKGGCGNLITYKGWCKVKWVSGNKFGVSCPVVENKRRRAISNFRIEEAKQGKNPMQNPKICKKNHSQKRNKMASLTLKKLGKLELLPQQKESLKLKEKRRENVKKALKKLWLEGKHPRQKETEEQKKMRFQKISKTLRKLASKNKLPMQNMSEEQKKKLGKKVSKTLRRRIKNGEIKLSKSWKKVPYKNFVFRSYWEKETAQFLDKNRIKWEYESLIIQYFDTERKIFANTIPDFYLPKSNIIIEVKSNADFKSTRTKDKLRWIKKQGYNVFLFGRKEIRSIQEDGENLLRLIKNEES